jgi:putative SOS response-associated peptidase YedK
VAPLHDRMPAILRPEDYERWVFEDCDTALKAVGPYPAQVMIAVQLEHVHVNAGGQAIVGVTDTQGEVGMEEKSKTTP